MSNEIKSQFSRKIAKDIAMKSFGHTLDCMLGYSDSGYSLKNEGEEFEQNFEEDLQSMGIVVNERRIKVIVNRYNEICKRFEKMVRAKYY